LAAIGGAIFALGYLPALYVASFLGEPNERGLEPLFIPIVGPFVTISTAHLDTETSLWAVAFGAVQAAGAGVGIAWLVLPDEKKLYRNDVRIRLTPTVGSSSTGLSVTGTF
jgi:hypothetical protein